jgi:hypothetical protein
VTPAGAPATPTSKAAAPESAPEQPPSPTDSPAGSTAGETGPSRDETLAQELGEIVKPGRTMYLAEGGDVWAGDESSAGLDGDPEATRQEPPGEDDHPLPPPQEPDDGRL